MGLDFTLYKKKKGLSVGQFYDQMDHMSWEEVVKTYELAYGRKSWELVYVLSTRQDVNEGYGVLKEGKWESLMRKLEPIGDMLESIALAFNHQEHQPEDYPELIFTVDDKNLIANYEYWYNHTFMESPHLGYQFSVSYMKSFWDARDKVREVLKDPDYEVLMSISY